MAGMDNVETPIGENDFFPVGPCILNGNGKLFEVITPRPESCSTKLPGGALGH